MDINLTLLGQMITFAVFIGFTMKFVWPPMMKALEGRRRNIADGLAAAEQGRNELEIARRKVKEQLDDAKVQAASIIEQANHRASHIVEESKFKAREEGERLLALAKGDIDQEYQAAKDELMQKVSQIAVLGAEKILKREIDKSANDRLINEFVGEMD